MRRFRWTMGQFAALAAVIAVDLAVFRSLLRTVPGSQQPAYLIPIDARHSLPFVALACGILPLVTLLAPASIAILAAIRRSGPAAASARVLGFVLSGWLAVLGFMVAASLSPAAVHAYCEATMRPFEPLLVGLLGPDPSPWLGESLEFAVGSIVLSAPQFLIAAAGALWAGGPGSRLLVDQAAERDADGRPAPRPDGRASRRVEPVG